MDKFMRSYHKMGDFWRSSFYGQQMRVVLDKDRNTAILGNENFQKRYVTHRLH